MIPAIHEKLVELFNKDDFPECNIGMIFVRTILDTDDYITLKKLVHIFSGAKESKLSH